MNFNENKVIEDFGKEWEAYNQKKLSNKEKTNAEYFDEKISINQLDYYHTNAISRSSKTMAECKNTKNNNLKNGTYN